jgi:hypothetical protein
MDSSTFSKSFFIVFLLFIRTFLFAQERTTVNGIVLDAKTKEPIAYATAQFLEGSLGVTTDNYGKFLLEKKGAMSEIRISIIGFQTQKVKIKPNQRNEITVYLQELSNELREITVRPEKYKRKNPAVDLIHEVFLHREQNRKEGLAYYQYDTHERLRFDVNGVTEKFKNQWYFNKFRYAFEFCDTSRVNQKVTLPFFFRERLLTAYYRKDPLSKKERLRAERQNAIENDYDVDKDGISSYINNMYTDVDIYAPTITLLNKEFVGPLSATATTFYRFYITDTVKIENERFASVYFSPINKNDLAFMGTMLVSLDSTYAVRKVDMGISKDINLNWVSDIKIKQDFSFQGEGKARRLLMSNDAVIFDMKIWKNREGRSFLATKTNIYNNYILNSPQDDTLYQRKIKILRDSGKIEKTPDFWSKNRLESLSDKEEGIKTMVDSIKNIRLYKILTQTGLLLSTGYQRVGKFEIGDLSSLYRYNDLEGNRWQLSARTSDRFFKHARVRAYTAYGTKDKAWKYGASTTFAFKGARPGRFPANQIKFSYDHDLYFPGLINNSAQTLSTSLQSSLTTRLLLNKIARIEYIKENREGFSYGIYGNRKDVSEASVDIEASPNVKQNAVTTELGGWCRYAPNEKFYQTSTQRINVKNKYPVFYFQYKGGIKDFLGGDYAFQKASLRIDKNFYLGAFGKSRASIEGGKVFGQVSYPFLEIHRANLTYFFDDDAFNLMNYLEFVSDSYATLHLNHDFQGILLNRIPLVKKLKWREGITFKALYGGLDQRNIPSANNQLLAFPVDKNKNVLTQKLGNMPYLEGSVGIGNIFGFLRIEYIKRLTYKENPNIKPWGIKLMASADF